VSDQIESLNRQLKEAQENLALIEERIAEYVLSTDVPLQLVKEQRRLEDRIHRLERRIADSRPIDVGAQATSVKQVFISHANEDADFAHRLAADLKRLGVRVWIAPESIRPGEEWVDAIERGLGESSHILIVLTPAALVSPWVRKETNVAIALERQGNIHVIPLDVEACKVPLLLSSYQMISFRWSYDAGFSQLADILELRVSQPEPVHLRRLKPFEPHMILIPAGEFLMGSNPEKDKGACEDEQPQHTLYLPDYYLARTSVTNAQYAAFVQDNEHYRPEHWTTGLKLPIGIEDHPVVYVSWHDAVAYCNWLAEVTGKAYRLPSEAEWEKGARGANGHIYPWGSQWNPERCNSKESGPGNTTPVEAYPEGASPYGLLDMAGNVWEWTRSLWGGQEQRFDFCYPYDPSDGRESLDEMNNSRRVLRGGSFNNTDINVRCAYRISNFPNAKGEEMGFRVAVSPSE
jgi:formylglycine-generating enzyme required for sulfatase activity